MLYDIRYTADKVFLHHWPKDTPAWQDGLASRIDSEINKNPDGKQITISGKTVRIGGYEFSEIRNVGISVPMFKAQCRLIFEGRCGEFHAHAHVTTGYDHISVCGRLSAWRGEFFPDSIQKSGS